MKRFVLALVLIFIILVVGFMSTNRTKSLSEIIDRSSQTDQVDNSNNDSSSETSPELSLPSNNPALFMKDVGEAYMDNFGLSETDFGLMKEAGITLIEGNFDICASDKDVKFFLDQSNKYGIKVVMPAGSGEAEWGYACEKEPFSKDQKPVWQKEQVQNWIKKWKGHSAIFGWDSSNEAGSVMPNSDKFMLTSTQLQVAYTDIKEVDAVRPVMIRMNGWFFYEQGDNPFVDGNPFAKGVADVVMLNAYSNVKDYYSDFVKTVVYRAKASIRSVDPKARITVSLGTWSEPPLWYEPSASQLISDIKQLEDIDDIDAVAFFKYGANNSEWYLPKDAPELWSEISRLR